MKSNTIWKLGKTVVAVMTAGVLVCGLTPAAKAQAAEVNNAITVSGQGSVKVKPDIAYISLGVTTVEKDAKTAQANNATAMSKVMAAVKAAGIEEKDIQTSYFSIYPNVDYGDKSGAERVISYSVSNNIQVKVRDINKSGAIIDAAVNAGANSSGNIQFALADPAAAYNQALVKAIANATDKANVMAKAIGKTIGAPSQVMENGSSYAPYTSNLNVAYAKDAAAGGSSFATGELDVTANVTMVFGY